MGKDWDSSGVAADPATWEFVLNVLRPGGHLVAFAGSRTYHRIAGAIDKSGFEVRDMLMWLYGTGFPKSLDVAKAIDASDAKAESPEDALRFTAWMRSTGITARQINEATQSFMASHYLTSGSQPAVATSDKFDAMRPYLPKRIPKWVEKLVSDRTQRQRAKSANLARRQVIGKHQSVAQAAGWRSSYDGSAVQPAGDITAPYLDEAKQWEGWGTALKPAHEPICLARKPFRSTVAGNVLAHGTGALNIDGCRVGRREKPQRTGPRNNEMLVYGGLNDDGGKLLLDARWPANVLHDASMEVYGAFPAIAREALRFFYGAKASRADREFGLEMMAKTHAHGAYGNGIGASPKVNGKRPTKVGNIHPTVKPTDLMRWLCRLTTPPGGTVIDPFMGSGSTGIAAVREGFEFIGIEQSAEYFDIACRRIEAAVLEAESMPTIEREIDRAVAKIRAEQIDLFAVSHQ